MRNTGSGRAGTLARLQEDLEESEGERRKTLGARVCEIRDLAAAGASC